MARAKGEPGIEAGAEPGLAGWERARVILASVFAERSPAAHVEVGRVKRIGAGLSRRQYAARIDLDPDPAGISGPYVVSIPFDDEPEASELARSTAREVTVLEYLASHALSFRAPRVVAVRQLSDGVAVVRAFADGIELDMRAGQQGRVRPWQVVAEIAASIHGVPLASTVRDDLGGHSTCEEFAAVQVGTMGASDHPLVARAAAWCDAHRPTGRAATLIHGDLLGQNILLDPGELPTVIDWEYAAIGDPAYDLAIVTRGVRRPFGLRDGHERLLDAYAAAGGAAIDVEAVHFYELCMISSWVTGCADREGSEQRLASLLGRTGG